MNALDTLSIPGVESLIGVAIDGNYALVLGSTGVLSGGFSNIGFSGTATFTVLDISNPDAPQILGKTLVTDLPFSSGPAGVTNVGGFGVTSLGNGLFAVSGLEVNGKPVLTLVDPSNPNSIAASYISVTSASGPMQVSGTTLYATSADGLTTYTIGDMQVLQTTVSVEVPNNGNLVIPGNSFNIPPAQTITGSTYNTLVWDFAAAYGNPLPSLTWSTDVSGVAVGQVVPVTLGGSVGYTTPGTSGTVALPGTNVTGVPIITLVSGTQTVEPGQTATYQVQITNPLDATTVYELGFYTSSTVQASWPTLGGNFVYVTLGPGQTETLPFDLMVSSSAGAGDNDFRVADSQQFGGATKKSPARLSWPRAIPIPMACPRP